MRTLCATCAAWLHVCVSICVAAGDGSVRSHVVAGVRALCAAGNEAMQYCCAVKAEVTPGEAGGAVVTEQKTDRVYCTISPHYAANKIAAFARATHL